MIKQLLSILLIFTVNILFFGHAVFSHHHHEGVPHFIFLEEEHKETHASEENSNCCCSHAPIEKESNCQLEKDIDVILGTDENYHSILCCASGDYHGLLLQAILLHYFFDLSELESDYSNKIPPYLISYLSVDVNRIHGLRAPPVCG